MVVQRMGSWHQLRHAIEQVFEAQVGADTLVEGVFVQDHRLEAKGRRAEGKKIIARTDAPTSQRRPSVLRDHRELRGGG